MAEERPKGSVALKTAVNLLSKGMDLTFIAEVTGLSETAILKLQKEK